MTEQISEKDLQEFYNKGVLAFEKQNYEYAIEIFSQLLSSKYDHLEARHKLHLSLRKACGEKPPTPIENIVHSIKKFSLGMVAAGKLKKNDLFGALEIFEKVLQSNPLDSGTLKQIADLFYKNNMLPQAISNLEEAKDVSPKDIDTFKRLGKIYMKKEDYQNAKSNYEQALKINPNDPEALKELKNLDALGTIQKDFGN